MRLKAAVWSLAAGIIGLVVGYLVGGVLGALLGLVVAPLTTFVLTTGMIALAARTARTWLMPSGSSTPYEAAFSQADALIMRTRFDEAIALLENAVMEDPRNPEPYLRLARLYRDQLKDRKRAREWLDHAAATGNAPAAVLRMERERLDRPRRG